MTEFNEATQALLSAVRSSLLSFFSLISGSQEQHLQQLRRFRVASSASIAVRALTDQISRRRGVLTERLLAVWARAIEVAPDSLTVSARLGATRLTDAVTALGALALLDSCATQLATQLAPLLASLSNPSVRVLFLSPLRKSLWWFSI
jgi:hypothetical protein